MLRFLAPELARSVSVNSGSEVRTSSASDIHSLAMMFWSIWAGKHPFPELPVHEAATAVCKGLRPSRPVDDVGISVERMELFWLLIQRMWDQDEGERPPAEVVCLQVEEGFLLLDALHCSIFH